MTRRRSFLVPETLQTSGMDCGPAALKSVFAGLSVPVSYERLREACSTSSDGTSIDAMEDLCNALGLEAFQEILPFADAAEILAKQAPAIAVVVGRGGAPHFLVVWRVVGNFVQVMDPASGRRWISRRELQRNLFPHQQPFDDESFREWFPTTEWSRLLGRRLAKLGVSLPRLEHLSANEIVAADGAARVLDVLVARGAAPRSARQEIFQQLVAVELEDEHGVIPTALSARARDLDGGFACRGAVFLAVRTPAAASASTGQPDAASGTAIEDRFARLRGPDAPSAFQVLARQLSPSSSRLAVYVVITVCLLAVLAFAEMLFLRAAFNAETLLSLPQQRLGGFLLYGGLVALVLLLETALGGWIVRLGLRLEVQTRLALLEKLPRLPDRYFRTRPMSDVAHRSQGLASVKPLPELFVTVAKQALDIVVTVVALCMLHPRGAPITLLGAAFALGAPFLGLSYRKQLESRVQSHASALGQLYIDVLFGLVPIRTHGGQAAVRSIQNFHLGDWRRESEHSIRFLSLIEATQSLGVLAAIVGLLLHYLGAHDSQTGLLLLVFWALRLPLEGRALASTLQRVPHVLAANHRLVEPLTAEETRDNDPTASELAAERAARSPGGLRAARGLTLATRDLGVRLSTQDVLSCVTLTIRSGEQVAIVGSSGAGKSSLLATILGLVEPTTGATLVDGEPLREYGVGRLRRETVWIDPTVQLWNRSLLHNVLFGTLSEERAPLDETIERACLDGVIERMPDGLATELGEGGARASGGEGQRVRIARALHRQGARLILLDEAFRGLDRKLRRSLSRDIRLGAAETTVLEVTHDVSDTGDFDRILVIEDGRLVEEGEPATLLATAGSRYAELVRADLAVQHGVWDDPSWRQLRVEDGKIEPSVRPAPPTPVAIGAAAGRPTPTSTMVVPRRAHG